MKGSKWVGDWWVVATAIACFGALIISIYPGALQNLSFWLMVVVLCAVPVVGVVGSILLIWLAKRGQLKPIKMPWRRLIRMGAIVLVCYLLVKFYIPRRLAFMASQPAFEQLLSHAPISQNSGVPLNRRLGFYQVDEYAADPRGGVYFRVYISQGILDSVSYGFTYKPNRVGSPFGQEPYRLFKLGDRWYWFSASSGWL